MSRKKFIESVGATCDNWNWSWSFVNHKDRFVVFGLWDVNKDGKIFDEKWKGAGRKQSLEHIRLIEEEGYQLKTFPMQYSKTKDGVAKIKSFDKILDDKNLTTAAGCWYASSSEFAAKTSIAEEVSQPKDYYEGATKKIFVNAYERNVQARLKCIEHYGCQCYICKFDFQKTYGERGKNFIHVHHEVPLFEIKKTYKVDPINDLKPLCPNCHAIIHRTHEPIKVDELIKELNEYNNRQHAN